MKIFFDCVIFDGESLVHASFSLLQLRLCAFATVFSEKSPILGAKVAKTSILAFLSVFLGTSLGALDFCHRSCKNRWEAAQNL